MARQKKTTDKKKSNGASLLGLDVVDLIFLQLTFEAAAPAPARVLPPIERCLPKLVRN